MLVINSILRASEADIPYMAALEARWSWKALPPNALSETGALFVPLGEVGLKKIIADKDSCILVSKNVDALEGMVVCCGKRLALEMWPYLSTSYAPNDNVWKEKFMYVKTVAVRPECTGRHIGRTLLLELEKVVIGMGQKSILAGIALDPPNKRSLSLFQHTLGCREIGRNYDEEKKIMWGLFKSRALS